MELLKERIIEQGVVVSPSVINVDRFLNHSIDPELMDAIGKAFAGYFQDKGITKVITIESSGIAPAVFTAKHLGVPMIFAKKAKPITMRHPLTAIVHSYTKSTDYTLCAEATAFSSSDNVLFIDDLLANGQAFLGIRSLLDQAGAKLGGVGICIEKSWQNGHELIDQADVPVCVLASIASMSDQGIVWNTDHETL